MTARTFVRGILAWLTAVPICGIVLFIICIIAAIAWVCSNDNERFKEFMMEATPTGIPSTYWDMMKFKEVRL